MNKYPWSDSTSSDVKKVLFKSGIRTFNEDFDSIEQYREDDSITRFNSIVKTPGVVAKKAGENTTLFPTVISGNQLKISSGVGFTNNGAMIEVQYDISISDIKAITGYQSPSDSTQVFLVLTKQIQEYAKRVQPITGELFPTRTLIKSDSSIVEFITISSSTIESNQFNDCVILGRLTSVDPATFDTTEATGRRKILRIGEQKFLEITGGIMEGNIDMNNKWEILNLPQWGKTYYVNNGSVHNLDFLRLFSRTNYNSFGIKSLKFIQSGAQFGIQFGSTTGPKMILMPMSKPPNKIDIVISNMFIPIPENNVLYLDLADYDLGIGSGIGIGVGVDSLNGQLTINSDVFSRQSINTGNYGTTVGNSLNKYPIAYHYYNAMYNTRYILFANGLVLNLNQEINENGYDSAYLHIDGSNEMIGDVKITKNNAQVVFKTSDGIAQGFESSGLSWIRSTDSVLLGSFKRFSSVLPDSDISIGDYVLVAMTNNATNLMQFVFKVDGRFKIPTAPLEYNDAVRKQELDLKVNKSGDIMTGDLVFVDDSTVVIKNQTPSIILHDTAPTTSYQAIDIIRTLTTKTTTTTAPLTRWMRLSETNTQLPIACNEGDLLFETHDNSGFGSAWFKLRFSDNSFIVNNLICTKVIADEVSANIINYANILQSTIHQSTTWSAADIYRRKRTFRFCLNRFNASDPVIFTNPVTGENDIKLGSSNGIFYKFVTARFNINYHYDSFNLTSGTSLYGIVETKGTYMGDRTDGQLVTKIVDSSASNSSGIQKIGINANVTASLSYGRINTFTVHSAGTGFSGNKIYVAVDDLIHHDDYPDGICTIDSTTGGIQSVSLYQSRTMVGTGDYPVHFFTTSLTPKLVPQIKVLNPTEAASLQIYLDGTDFSDALGVWSAEIEIDEQYRDKI